MAANRNPPSPLPPALGALAEHKQFIVWQAQTNRKGGKPIKVPLNPENRQRANPHNPAVWLSAERAYQFVTLFNDGATPINGIGFYGVGFVLTASDPFFCLDIDNCLEGSKWSQFSLGLIERLPGAAVEVSHSDTGMHVWGTARPMPPHRCRNAEHPTIELYSDKRFIALGRPDASGDIRTDCTAALNALIATYLLNNTEATGQGEIEWTSAPCDDWDGDIDDDDLIQAALNPRPTAWVMFDNDITFRDLWEANADALGKKWPHAENDYDRSRADASLAQRLAFWTGKDCERIQGLMVQSHLRRDKWDREDYLPRTIRHAVSQQTEVYDRNYRNKPQGDGAAPSDPAPSNTLAVTSDAPFQIREDDYGETTIANILRVNARPGLHCYDPERNNWYTREVGRLWRVDPRAVTIKWHIRRLMDQTKNLKRGSAVDGVLKAAQPDLAVIGPWDDDPELCGLPDDRVLVLADGTIREAANNDRITRRLSVMPESGTPTRWFQFLRETVPEHDANAVIAWLQRWCGYVLTGHTRARKFIFLSGSGGNGKSVFVDTLAAVLGDYATAIPADGLLGNRSQHRQWVTPCDGGRLAHVTEVSPGSAWRLADLKDLTGGGLISANRMHSNSYTFQPTAKLIIAGNDRPALPSVDTAIGIALC